MAEKLKQRTLNSIDIASQLIGVPLMVSDAMAQLIVEYVKTGGVFDFPDYGIDAQDDNSDIAVINVFGGMSHRSWWRSNYESIRADFRAAMSDTSVKAILFNMDTPGGVVAGNFDLADEIYHSRDEKPIYAFVNEQATSAGYSLASSARKVFAPRTGIVGSVGVRMVHVDYSKMDERMGIDISIIYAGARKIDFDDSKPLTDEARAVGQRSVDKAYELFLTTVARNRGMDVEDVRKTEAGIYEGEDAVDVGFVDEILSFDDAIKQIKTEITRR